MKKQLAKLAFAAVLGLASALTFSCGKWGDVKLPERITDDNILIKSFEYDEQNRIAKINDKVITYSDNLITAGDEKFVINDNTIKVGKVTLTIDKDGYLVSRKDSPFFETYEYKDGNLIGRKDDRGDGNTYNYQYDNKKSPFSNCNSPKWLLQYLGEPFYASKNNITETNLNNELINYKNEYDKDGFLIKWTIEYNNVIARTIGFIYRGTAEAEAMTEWLKERAAQKAAAAETEAAAEAEAAEAARVAEIEFVKKSSCPDATTVSGTMSCGGQNYKTVVIGTQTWMAENMNYYTEGSKCYDNKESNCKKYGRLYDLKTAKLVCPKGWHLPNNEEWDVLIKFVNPSCSDIKDCPQTGAKLKAAGFSDLLGGHGSKISSSFTNINSVGYWWNASENDNCRYLINYGSVRYSHYDKDAFLSVRCLQDSETAASESKAEYEECDGECYSDGEGPPITIEAVFLRNDEFEGMSQAIFRLPNGEEIWFNDEVKEVKEGDKISLTYRTSKIYTAENDGGYMDINSIISLKKIGDKK